MELKILDMQLPAPIRFNYDELKAELEERVRHYAGLVYGENEIREAKADRANLNKLKKALNDERIKREREYNAPFQIFKAQINEIIDMIDRPIQAIDVQIKAYEEQRREKKRSEIMQIIGMYELPYEIPSDRLFDEKWLNVGYTGDKIGEEIDAKLDQIQNDVEILEDLPEYRDEAILTYKDTLDIRAALKSVETAKAKAADIDRVRAHIAEQKAKYSGQPEAVQPPQAEPEIQTVKAPAAWVRFEAYLTAEQAKALKAFFVNNKIEFRRA